MKDEIIGHYNPFSEYPSKVIPVHLDGDNKLGIHYDIKTKKCDQNLTEQDHFVEYSKSKPYFNPNEAFLFQFSENEDDGCVVENKDRQSFFNEKFEEGFFDDLNPFIALSFAIDTEDVPTIRRVLRTCILELKSESSGFIESWYLRLLDQKEFVKIKKYFKNKSAFDLLEGLPTLRIGGSTDLSLTIRRLARVLNNGLIDMSKHDMWIEPITSDKYILSSNKKKSSNILLDNKEVDILRKEIYKEIDVIITESFEQNTRPDYNSFISPARTLDIGNSSIILAIDPMSDFAGQINDEYKIYNILNIAVHDNEFKWMLPDPSTRVGLIINERIKRTIKIEKWGGNKKSLSNRLFYSSYSEAFNKAFQCGEWRVSAIIGQEHAILSYFSDAPAHLRPKIIKSENSDLNIAYKALLLNPGIITISDSFNRLEEYLKLPRILSTLEYSGINRRQNQSEKEQRINFGLSSEKYEQNDDNIIFKGKYGVYKKKKDLGAGVFGKTIIASVIDINTANRGAYLHGPIIGRDVVIKFPYILPAGYTNIQKREYLNLINISLKKQYDYLTRIVLNKNVAPILDEGDVNIINEDGVEDVSHFIVNKYIKESGDCVRLTSRERLSQLKHPVDSGIFFKIARNLTNALKDIHQAGVIHGNICPNNIFISRDLNPIFVDFGQISLRSDISYENDLCDNPYLSPEKDNTIESDIYSLCSTLYYLATSQAPPFSDKDSLRVKNNISNKIKEYNASLYTSNTGIADIIARGLRYYKNDRTSNTQKLLEDIDLFDPQNLSVDTAKSKLKDIQRIISEIKGTDPLFACMAMAKIDSLFYFVQKMKEGNYDVLGSHDDIVMAMSQFMSYCKNDDIYLTASIPWLWYTGNMGVNGRLLSINKQVIKKGTILRRVFVLTINDLQDPRTLDVLSAHNQMMCDIKSDNVYINASEWLFDKKGGYTGVYIIDEENKEELFNEYPHSGTWLSFVDDAGSDVKKNKPIINMIQPFYDNEKKLLTGVRLKSGDIYGDTSVDDIKDKFINSFLSKSIEIGDFMKFIAQNPYVSPHEMYGFYSSLRGS